MGSTQVQDKIFKFAIKNVEKILQEILVAFK